jgi:hypothetical protein
MLGICFLAKNIKQYFLKDIYQGFTTTTKHFFLKDIYQAFTTTIFGSQIQHRFLTLMEKFNCDIGIFLETVNIYIFFFLRPDPCPKFEIVHITSQL